MIVRGRRGVVMRVVKCLRLFVGVCLSVVR